MEKIKIELTNDEALVLFEFLARVNKNYALEKYFEDPAEQSILCDLECILESQLVEIFSPNYLELVNKARDKIRFEK